MHRQIIDLLSAYHDGELPAAQRAQVEAHLRTCAACWEQLAQLQTLSALLGTYSVEVGATEEFWKRLEPRLPVRKQTASPAPVRPRPQPRQPWLFLPPMGLLFSKAMVQAVMLISLALWGVYSLGLLPTWADHALNVTASLPDFLTKSITLTLASQVVPSMLPALMDYTIGQAPSALSALAGFFAPALLYAIVGGVIAFLYLTWTALWWRELRSAPISNGS
jgi:hypothetical protein